jgi:acetolactate synthase-1/2/3 large subunit
LSDTGAARVVQALEQLGVELVFGLPGVHNLAIWDELRGSPIRLVGVRHEQAAVYAADGYARATGRLGAALVTTGPGAANTLGATGEAMASSSPVLVIATDIPAALRRPGVHRGVLHETRDQPAMFAPVTKAASTVASANEIGTTVIDAGRLALEPSSGPVYVGIPTDLLKQPVHERGRGHLMHDAATHERGRSPLVHDAVEMIAAAERPLIWGGGGALRSGAGEAVARLAEALAAPVVTTYMARGLLSPSHPCFVPGPVHHPEVGGLWDEADLVIGVGTDFDGLMTQNWTMPAPPRLIAVNVDEADANKSYSADVTLVGDAKPIVEELVRLVHESAPSPNMQALRGRLDAIGSAVRTSIEEDDPEAARFLAVMQRVLPDDAIVVADMCIPGYWLGGFHPVPAPRKLAFPMGWGTLGFGFPASIGSALSGSGPAVCVIGDGGFLFACGELATVAQEDVPLTVVIVDDGGYGMLRYDQLRTGDEPFGVDLTRPDFAALAASFGIPATTVDGFGADFESVLAQAVRSGRATVIVVNAALTPPPTTSPRWYRRKQEEKR